MKKTIPVLILYDTVESGTSGGANSFVLGLKQILSRSRYIDLVEDISSAQVVLTISARYGDSKSLKPYMMRNVVSGRMLRHPYGFFYGKKRKKIIHRLNGLGRIYGRKDNLDDLQIKINSYADVTVFQSEYCRDIFSQVGVIPQKKIIIGNGANPDWFKLKPVCAPGSVIKIIGCSWSNNLNKGFDVLVEWSNLKNVEVSFVGRWPERIEAGKVRLLGSMHQKDFAEVLKLNDLLLYPSQNDACPNVVYEALASGLPVVYHPSGGTPEICRKTLFGEPLRDNPQETLERILDRYHETSERIRDHSEEFFITHAAKMYEKIFLES